MAAGHEIGNHTVGHPCTGNFAWVRYDSVVLESYDLERMRAEILQANEEIEDMLGRRAQAREDKDFASADRIRDQLTAAGVVIEDTADGAIWYRA